ncbi:hypothetical protein FRC03_000274 [Tulasnella sp. 419]|nr:hypothetical protein FRC03_000274 [Tulasnella sp. 419]
MASHVPLHISQHLIFIRSFHALDDTGAINVWGTLHGEVDQESPEDDPWFAEPGATAFTPIKLELPNRMVAVSCSRSHSAALDAKNRVWIFTRWGRPSLLTFTGDLEYAHRHPRINNTKVIQVECGWGFTSFLTEDGRAYVIWPGSGSFADQEAIKNSDLDREGEKYQAKAVNGVVKCLPVEISAEPLTLPELPELPPLSSSVDEKPKGSAGTNPKLIKIAAGDHFIIGLTDQGHVVCIDLVGGDGEEDGVGYLRSVFTNGQRGWDYLPEYCDIQNVVKDPVYSPSDSGAPKVAAPKKLKITHISAHFNYFVAYSPNECSTVLMSFVKREDKSTIGSITRTIHPTLQNKDIISIVLGDYHFGALHADGTLYTWGAYSNGALGLGDPLELPIGAPGGYATAKDLRRARRDSDSEEITPPEVSSPTPVRFDWYHPGRKRFCYAVAAAGWHMGALVIDLDEYPDDEEAVRLAMVKKRQRSFSMRRFFRRYLCGCFGI